MLNPNAQFETNMLSRAVSIVQTVECFALLAILMCALACFAFSLNPYCISSAAMEPEIPLGALVLVDTKTAPENIFEGDVVAYTGKDGATVAQRVVANDTQLMTLATKGDASASTNNDAVSYNDVIGKSVFSIPIAGKVYEWLLANKVFVVIVLVGGNIILSLFSLIANRLWKDRKRLLKKPL